MTATYTTYLLSAFVGGVVLGLVLAAVRAVGSR